MSMSRCSCGSVMPSFSPGTRPRTLIADLHIFASRRRCAFRRGRGNAIARGVRSHVENSLYVEFRHCDRGSTQLSMTSDREEPRGGGKLADDQEGAIVKTVEGMRSGAGGALPSADTLDRDDPLRAQRDQFSIPQGLLYFAGHSLGAPRLSVSDRLAEVEREWRRHLVRAWGDCGWIDLPRQVGAKLASLIGAAPDEVVCADSTSVNLYKTVFAALPLAKGRRVILTERDNFPTDLYILEGLARQARTELRVVESDQIQTAIDGDVAVVALSHVN